MLCKGQVPEPQGKRPCWLPAETGSSYGLCRRCHFNQTNTIIDTLTIDYGKGILHPQNELSLGNQEFLQELLHPAREQALLNLLFSLFQNNKIQFQLVLEKLKQKTVFPILITKRLEMHHPGTKCKMYSVFLKDPKLYTSNTLCWSCWSCILWVLQKNDPRLLKLYTDSFGRSLSRFNYDTYTTVGSRVFLEILIWMYLRNFDHHIRMLLHTIFLVFPHEEYRRFLSFLFQEGPMLPLFLSRQSLDLIPVPFRDETVSEEMWREIKIGLKKRCSVFKEELMIKTWHPSRFLSWCLDIGELNDF